MSTDMPTVVDLEAVLTATTPPANADVVIVGAGPAGLTLAASLATASVDFVLLDRQAEGANTSRAAVVHARTLEVLETLGITQGLVERGTVIPKFTVRDRDRVLMSLAFDHLPTAYPYALMVPQNVTEALLLERLHELRGDVLRPYEVVGVSQDDDGATVTSTCADGGRFQTRARYVVGSDGMYSTVRDQAAIGFAGAAYAHSFVLADVRMAWPLGREEAEIFFCDAGLAVVAPLPGEKHYRIVAAVDEAPERPSLAEVRTILDNYGPSAGVRIEEILWSGRFRVHHRVAEAYRAGRILLAGDAAHVHSPAGGQGMNTGIQDAVKLAEVLTVVLAGGDVGRLDEYERVRRPIAQRVVAFTDRMTRIATLESRPKRALRNTAMALFGRVPQVRDRLTLELSELNN
jgi:2-polyprenyl-6-methoxyphenol hydroxylase-like FAD-dependent oxidoreductase